MGGGVSGTAREILKYGVEAVDYVELDPLVLEVGRRWLPENLADPRIHALATDGRLYVKQTPERYDVVILDVPDPSTSQVNRFYTREFFAEVRRILIARRRALACRSGTTTKDTSMRKCPRVLATAHRTLKEVFANVLVIPGGKVFFVASDGPLTTDIAERIERAGIATRVVNRPYLAAMLTPSRMADIRRALADDAPINRDFSPVLYYYHLRYWMSQFKVRFGLFEAALLALVGGLSGADPAGAAGRLCHRLRRIVVGGGAAGRLPDSLRKRVSPGRPDRDHVHARIGSRGAGDESRALPAAPPRPGVAAGGLAVFAACLPAALMGLGHLGGLAAPAAARRSSPSSPCCWQRWWAWPFRWPRNSSWPGNPTARRRRRRVAALHGRLYRGLAGGTVGQHASDSPAWGGCRMPPDRRPMLAVRRHFGRDGANGSAARRMERSLQTQPVELMTVMSTLPARMVIYSSVTEMCTIVIDAPTHDPLLPDQDRPAERLAAASADDTLLGTGFALCGMFGFDESHQLPDGAGHSSALRLAVGRRLSGSCFVDRVLRHEEMGMDQETQLPVNRPAAAETSARPASAASRRKLLQAGAAGLACAACGGGLYRYFSGRARAATAAEIFPGDAPQGQLWQLWKDRGWVREARHYLKLGKNLQCKLCPNECLLGPEDRGRCRNRVHKDGTLYTLAYGNPSMPQFDAIEKKPLFHFLPGSTAFSFATTGCGFRCLNCQNWNLSQRKPEELKDPRGPAFEPKADRAALGQRRADQPHEHLSGRPGRHGPSTSTAARSPTPTRSRPSGSST